MHVYAIVCPANLWTVSRYHAFLGSKCLASHSGAVPLPLTKKRPRHFEAPDCQKKRPMDQARKMQLYFTKFLRAGNVTGESVGAVWYVIMMLLYHNIFLWFGVPAWCVHVQRVPAMLQILGCPMNSCLFMLFLRACALKKYALSMSHGSDHTGVHVTSSLHSTNISSIQSGRRAVWNFDSTSERIKPSFPLSLWAVMFLTWFFIQFPVPAHSTLQLLLGALKTPQVPSNQTPWLLDVIYLQGTWPDSESCV